MGHDDVKKTAFEIFSNKKYQWVATILILVVVLFMSSSIRLSNWNLLTDHTTGEKIPLALDPFYFLRVAETIVADNGTLPKFDVMRYNPIRGTPWHPEILPKVVVGMWRISSAFGNYSLHAVDVAYPVVFYIIGLSLFFIFIYFLSRSKSMALLSSIFLAFNPGYLYRTMAGFSDHEPIGMAAFYFSLLIYVLSMIAIKKYSKKYWMGIISGILFGMSVTLTYSCWTGVTDFLFMIIPISFFLFWIFENKNSNSNFKITGILFYLSWVVSAILFGPFLGRSFSSVVSKLLLSANIFGVGVLLFLLVDLFFIYFKPKFINEKFRLAYSLFGALIIGFASLLLIGKNPIHLVSQIINYLIVPFGNGRFGTTVAENAQPFFRDWINSIGLYTFWLFFAGATLFGFYLSKKIKNKKSSFLFLILYVFMNIGIIFSKYSADSFLNGNNFISKTFYLVSLLSFFCYLFYIYFKNDFKWDYRDSLIFAIIFFVIVSGRAAARVFFVITPFACFLAAYFLISLYYIWKDGNDEIFKIITATLLIIGVFAGAGAIYHSFNASTSSASRTGPSANYQWQSAMSWVRNNTDKDSVFVHWWDYGYWVQTLGERATVADGGQFQGADDGNHKLGRYVLTTTNPETAYSYFKSMNVTHLLIDQSDLGKYPAYSKIGGADGVNALDRFASIPIGLADPRQTIETSNETRIVYVNPQNVFSGKSYVLNGLYEDIIYKDKNNNSIFLPAGKAMIIGIMIEVENSTLKQPEAVYIYNNVQTHIPLRYLYVNHHLIDFGNGLNATADIIPSFSGKSINQMGAVIYLSQKVSKSLFADMFLMDDAFGMYSDLKLVHTEPDRVVAAIKSQGAPIGDFIYYHGFRGPIKIWETGYPENTRTIPEFYESINFDKVGFGSLDKLFE